MSEAGNASYDSIKEGCLKILDPAFIGDYPFEYIYRLLLVYCYTKKTAISKVRAEDMQAFDQVFSEPFRKVIAMAASFRGIEVDDELLAKLSAMVDKSFAVYVKTQMKLDPSRVSHSLSQEMDDVLSNADIEDKSSLLLPVFAEAEA